MSKWNRRKFLSTVGTGAAGAATIPGMAQAGVSNLDANIPLEPLEDRTKISKDRSRANPKTITEAGDSTVVTDAGEPGDSGVLEYAWDHRVFAEASLTNSHTEVALSWVDFEISDVYDPGAQVDYGLELELDIDGVLKTGIDAINPFSAWNSSKDTERSNYPVMKKTQPGVDSSVRPQQEQDPDFPGPVSPLDIGLFLSKTNGAAGYTIGAKIVKLTENSQGGYDLLKTGVKNKDAYTDGISGITNTKGIELTNRGIELDPAGYSDQVLRLIFGVGVEANTSGSGTAVSDFKTSGKGVRIEKMDLWVDSVR